MERTTRVVGRAFCRFTCSSIGCGHRDDLGSRIRSERTAGVRSGRESVRRKPSSRAHRGDGRKRYLQI
jgi:hypothetical protein